MDKYSCLRFPVHAQGETYIVFHEESDFQVENHKFRQAGLKMLNFFLYPTVAMYDKKLHFSVPESGHFVFFCQNQGL